MKIGRKTLFLGLGSVLIIAGLWGFLSWEAFPGHREIKSALLNKLSKEEPLPTTEFQLKADDAIYVLGGSVQSLFYRFRTASHLYRNGVAKRILIDSDPKMMMEFDPSISRNLTFNEWAIKHLETLGVSKEDIEPVIIEKGFFGTYQEAKEISRFVSERGYKALVLVTSSYHTRRTWESFSKFLGNRNVNLYIYKANEDPSIPSLLKEYLKLEVYQILLL